MAIGEVESLNRLVFLGTGTSQGVPVIGCPCEVCRSNDARDQRLRTSVMMESASTRLVVDTGPDFRMQMLREGVTKLDGVVYTHEHKDHLAGMDDVRPFNYMQKATLPLHASARVEQALRRDFHYAFEERRHGGVPNVEILPIEDHGTVQVGRLVLSAVPVIHGKLPIHGFVAGDLAYITDASALPASTLSQLQGVEVLILNALRPEPHYSHFNLDQALEVAAQVGAKQTWFTHISHLMGTHETRDATLPAGVGLAYDGLVLTREGVNWVTSMSAWRNSMRP